MSHGLQTCHLDVYYIYQTGHRIYNSKVQKISFHVWVRVQPQDGSSEIGPLRNRLLFILGNDGNIIPRRYLTCRTCQVAGQSLIQGLGYDRCIFILNA